MRWSIKRDEEQQNSCHQREPIGARKRLDWTGIVARGRTAPMRARWQSTTSPLPEMVLFELAVEALAIDAERARRLVLVAAALAERCGDDRALRRVERRHVVAEVDHGRVRRMLRAYRRGQARHGDRLLGREGEGALDQVLQLTDVARPIVGDESLERRGLDGFRLDVEGLRVA